MALKDDVKEHLRLNDLSPEETSTASLAGSLGAHPAEIADVLDELAADVPLTADDIRDHYRRVRDVYTDIAALDADPEARTGGVIDNSGWYDSRSNADDFAALEEGYDSSALRTYSKARPTRSLVRAAGVFSTLTTYSPVMDREEPFKWTEKSDGSPTRDWRTEGPLPDYDEIVGQALFADVDVADEHKERPSHPRSATSSEAALEVYVDRFAALAGGRDHVLLLDSVGGAYPMIPPSATAPLAEQFTAPEDRQLVYEHLCSRMDEWLADIWSVVQETVPGADEYLDPDNINNKTGSTRPR